jgi:hypothetical protein
MNKQNLILGIIIATLTATAFAVTNDKQVSKETDAKSVAWYTANIREARQKNKECFENKELQSTTDCKNSLHALEISYKGI